MVDIENCKYYIEESRNIVLSCTIHPSKKSIYELKQTSKYWFDKLSATLLFRGFFQNKSDYSLFISSTRESNKYDIIVIGNETHSIIHAKLKT